MDIAISVQKDSKRRNPEVSELSKVGVIEALKISPDGKRIGVIMTTPKSPSIFIL